MTTFLGGILSEKWVYLLMQERVDVITCTLEFLMFVNKLFRLGNPFKFPLMEKYKRNLLGFNENCT